MAIEKSEDTVHMELEVLFRKIHALRMGDLVLIEYLEDELFPEVIQCNLGIFDEKDFYFQETQEEIDFNLLFTSLNCYVLTYFQFPGFYQFTGFSHIVRNSYGIKTVIRNPTVDEIRSKYCLQNIEHLKGSIEMPKSFQCPCSPLPNYQDTKVLLTNENKAIREYAKKELKRR